MTLLEDQLRAVLAGTATPPTSTADPLADLERRVGRARTRWAAAGVAATAVLIAAIVVPLTVLGHSSSHGTTFTTPAPKVLSGASFRSMTVAPDGSVWTLSGIQHGPEYLSPVTVDRRDPTTGQLKATYSVPTYMRSIAYAGGQIWVWGESSAGAAVHTIDVTSGTTSDLVDVDPRDTLASADVGRGRPFAAVGHYLVVLASSGRSALAFRLSGSRIESRSLGRIQAAKSMLLDGSTLVLSDKGVASGTFNAADIAFPGTNTSVDTRIFSGMPLAQGVGGVWTAEGSPLAEQTGLGGQVGTEVIPPRAAGMDHAPYAEPYSVVADADGGLYVGWSRSADSAAQASYLAYYSAKALSANSPKPTAVVPNAGARDLAANPGGGVVYLKAAGNSANGALTVWDPTAPKLTGKPATVRPVLWSDHRVLSQTVSADGSVWTLSTNRRDNPTFYVERHEPAAGEVVAKYAVPAWAESVTAAGDEIWVWGGGDGGYPDGYVEAIDSTTGHHVIRDLGRGKAILPEGYAGHSTAPIASGLFAVLEDRMSLVEIGLNGPAHVTVTPLATVPNVLKVFSDGDFGYASSATQNLRVVALTTTARARRKKPGLLSGPPLAVPPHGLIVNEQSQVTEEQSSEGYLGMKFKAPASNGRDTVPVLAALDPSGGLYVGWAAQPGHAAQILTYYSHANLSTDRIVNVDPSSGTVRETEPGPPDASVTGSQISDLSIDIAGGVVYRQGGPSASGTVARWDP